MNPATKGTCPVDLTEGYFSLLICHHPKMGATNVYANGLPIGTIKDGVITLDPLHEKRNPLGSLCSMGMFMNGVLLKLHDEHQARIDAATHCNLCGKPSTNLVEGYCELCNGPETEKVE